MHSLIEDLSTLTTIPTSNFKKLSEKIGFIICDCVEESRLSNSEITEIDCGVGTLSIKVDENNITYRFSPSKTLEGAVRETITKGKSPLSDLAEETLVRRLLHTYKDFI